MENIILKLASMEASDVSAEISVFKSLAEKSAALINEAGYNIKPYSPESLEKLSIMDAVAIRKCCSKFIHDIQLMETTSVSKFSNKDLVRSILNLMKICASDEFVDGITDEDIVEVYNPQGIQMFRNLKFYETTTYSLADLAVFEWYELYSRPTKVYEQLSEYVHHCFNKASNHEVISLDHLSTHIIKEIKASPINLCEVKFGRIAPVSSFGGANAGLIVTCRANNMLSLSHESITFI